MKIKYVSGLCLMSITLMFTACQKDELAKPFNNDNIKVRQANCADCINEGETSGTSTFTGNYNPTFHATVTVTNTLTAITYSVTSNSAIHKLMVGAVSVYCNNSVPATQPVVYSIALGTFGQNWMACDVVATDVCVGRSSCAGGGPGNQVLIPTSIQLVGLCLDELPCDIQVGDYTTYSQGFYLAAPPGEAFLINNWGTLGPVVIGCDENTTSYNTPASIYDLTTGGGHANVFRNQLITLILNSRVSADLDCLIVVDGAFAGMTVAQIIALANNVLGGCTAEPEGLLDLLDTLNKNFHEGTVNQEALTCCAV
jgi:hypothetical protein